MSFKTGTNTTLRYIEPYNPRSKLAIKLAYIGELGQKGKLKYKAYELYETGEYKYEQLSKIFEVHKSTMSRWVNQVRKAKQIRRYQILKEKSRAPKHTPRIKKRDFELKAKIKKLRRKYKCGKTKLSKYLKREYNIKISPSTIQREINSWDPSEDPINENKVKIRKVKKRKSKKPIRIKDVVKKLKWRAFERFQIDTKYWAVNGVRFYIVTAVDVVTRMGFARAYSRHTATCAADFLRRMIYAFELHPSSQLQVYFQRDNGSEFAGDFEEAAQENGITLLTNYVCTPEMNGYVERFNRTIKDELLEYSFASTVKEANDSLFQSKNEPEKMRVKKSYRVDSRDA